MMAEALGGSEAEHTVSKDTAIENYIKAGELIPEDAEQITLEKYQHLLSDSVHLIIQEVLEEHHVPFKLQQFQMLTLHALGSLKPITPGGGSLRPPHRFTFRFDPFGVKSDPRDFLTFSR